jgi:hypothetical protein
VMESRGNQAVAMTLRPMSKMTAVQSLAGFSADIRAMHFELVPAVRTTSAGN